MKLVRNAGTVIALTTISSLAEFRRVTEEMEEQVAARNELCENSLIE